MPLHPRRLAALRHAAPLAILMLVLLPTAPAAARGHVTFGFGFPVWGPPPIYYPPPAYYAPPAYYPPPAYYAPPAYYPPPAYYAPPEVYAPPEAALPGIGRSCDAGPYVCPLEHPLPVGASCWCRDNAGRRAFGRSA